MSEFSSPMSAVFEFQRSAIQGTHEAIENGVQAQKSLNETFVDGFGPARATSERSTDLARMGIDAYFDAVESAVPAGSGFGEVREMMHESIDTLEKSQLDALDEFEVNLQESAESTAELLDEFLAALDEQVATLLDAHEDLEDQTVEALERLEDSIEELQMELEAQGDEMQKQLEAQANAVREQLEEVTESVQETADSADLAA